MCVPRLNLLVLSGLVWEVHFHVCNKTLPVGPLWFSVGGPLPSHQPGPPVHLLGGRLAAALGDDVRLGECFLPPRQVPPVPPSGLHHSGFLTRPRLSIVRVASCP